MPLSRAQIVGLLASALVCGSIVAGSHPSLGSNNMQFSGKDVGLERAIAADDATAVRAALTAGALVNARGAHGVTPLEFAVGSRHKRAAAELIRHSADPNLKDAEGDNAVTLAVSAYARDPELLRLLLDAGGDPNTRRPDGDPVMVRFLNDRNLQAITYLHSRGASIDAMVNGRPMIVDAAYGTDWDVVWRLIELGARLDTPAVKAGLSEAFKVPGATLPDSPIYPYKVNVWHRLKELGLHPTPPAGMQAD
jgi:uncharacterized protein